MQPIIKTTSEVLAPLISHENGLDCRSVQSVPEPVGVSSQRFPGAYPQSQFNAKQRSNVVDIPGPGNATADQRVGSKLGT
jgi:hypothetical protein